MSAIVELLLQTGMRISELANLHTEDIKKTRFTSVPWKIIPAALSPSITRLHRCRKLPGRSPRSSRHSSLYHQNRSSSFNPQYQNRHRPLFQNRRRQNRQSQRPASHFHGPPAFLRLRPLYLSQIVGHKRLSSTTKYLDFVKPQSPLSSRLTEL